MNLSSNCIKCGCAFTGQAVIGYREDWRCKSHTVFEAMSEAMVDDMPDGIESYRNFKAEERWG